MVMLIKTRLYEVVGGLSGFRSQWGAHGLHSCGKDESHGVYLHFSYLSLEQVLFILLHTPAAGYDPGGVYLQV